MLGPLIRSIKIDAYRGLRNIDISGLRRVNVIGGANGTGKSSLLEAIFTFLDMQGPVSLLRPMQFRQFPGSYENARSLFFSNASTFTFNIETRDSRFHVSYTWEDQPVVTGSASISGPNAVSGESTSKTQGVTIQAYKNNQAILERHAADVQGSLAFNDTLNAGAFLPPAVMLSRATLNAPGDVANRYSNAVQTGKKRDVIRFAKELAPGLVDLELLQSGGIPVLHGELEGGNVIPISFFGDGVSSLMSATLAIMSCRDGVVLLDEFDAAVYFRALPKVWSFLHHLAVEVNCQLFIATHSREAIGAAAAAVGARNPKDYVYIRLDNLSDRTAATSYTQEDVAAATTDDWELR